MGEGSKCPCFLLPSLPCTLDPEQIPGALGADTLICLMGETLPGPLNSRQARAMLRSVLGRPQAPLALAQMLP